MNQSSRPTRLREYINAMLPDAHGHQKNAIFDFVSALLAMQTCCQAELARFFGNQEAALKRLARFLRNERMEVQELALSTARALIAQLPLVGPVRLAIDWTIEGEQHLLVASLMVGRRGVPMFWRAYQESELKDRRSGYEREFVRTLVTEVLCEVSVRRQIVTADRAFADVEFFDLLNDLGVSFVIRSKGSVKVCCEGGWRKLSTLRLKGNTRRRSLGRLFYCESDPRRQYVAQCRARDQQGRWGIWHLVSNRPLSPHVMMREYARRFGCEEGFRDAKWMLGFSQARIKCLKAWTRMFTLVALALIVLVGVGCRLLADRERLQEQLRRITSRRKARAELSLVRVVAELLKREISLWELVNHDAKLNLEASL
ncbi:MAG: transposase [Acidobacteria bacterium]|nr:transposase [Acidobacteriota bacterium]